MTAFQSISCRLCLNICNDHRSLYDEDGRGTEVYALTEKYFAPLFLNMECVDHFAVLCMECWRHISEFHTFQQTVLEAQNKYTDEVVVKSEVENQMNGNEFITTTQPQSMVTYEICSLGPEDFTNSATAMFSPYRGNDSCIDDATKQQYEDIVVVEPLNDRVRALISDYDVDQPYEAIVKSEIEEPLNNRVSVSCSFYHADQQYEAVVKSDAGKPLNDRGRASCSEEDVSEAIVKSEVEESLNDRGSVQDAYEQNGTIVKSKVKEPLNDRGRAHCSYEDAYKQFAATVKSGIDEPLNDPGSASCSDDDEYEKCEAIAKSEVELMAYIGTDVSPRRVVITKKPVPTLSPERLNVSCEQETQGPDTTYVWEDLIDPVCVVVGGEFGSASKCLSESAGHFSSDDGLSLDECEASRRHLKLLAPIKDNLATKSDGNSQSETIPKRRRKYPETLEEYDNLIAQWQPNLECVICSALYSSFSFLQQHFDKRHPAEKCHIVCCQQKFYQRCEIEKHIHLHDEANCFPCGGCAKSFATKYNLWKHVRTKHAANANPEMGHTCEECGDVYRTFRSLQKHALKFHGGKTLSMKCTHCDRPFKDAQNFRDHMRSHAGKPLFTCPFCQMPFMRRTSFYSHVRGSHYTEWAEKMREQSEHNRDKNIKVKVQIYKCRKCKNVYNSLADLGEHMAIKHKKKPKTMYTRTCRFCPKTFKYLSDLCVHLKISHRKEWEEKLRGHSEHRTKSYKCATCENAYETALALHEHQATSH